MRNTKKAMIDVELIRSKLSASWLAHTIYYADATESTNADAKKLIADGAPHGSLVVCGMQTHGRGRRGRSWLCDGDGSLCMSLILRPDIETKFAPRYTLATALGVCIGVRSLGADASIKWPNDILCGGRKLCGILLELSGNASRPDGIVIGIGLNVGQEAFPDEISDVASSVRIAAGKSISREEAAAVVLNELEKQYERMANDEFSDILCDYCALSDTLGREVNIIGADGTLVGKVCGFDELGRIILLTEGGETLTVNSGDVSLRSR